MGGREGVGTGAREAQVTYVQRGSLLGHDAEDGSFLNLGIHVLSLLCPFVTLCNCAEETGKVAAPRAGGGLEGWWAGPEGQRVGVGSRRWAGSGGSVGWGHSGDPAP